MLSVSSFNGAAIAPQRRIRVRQPATTVVRAQAAATGTGVKLNKYSSRITQPKSQGASQAMLYATGLKEEDMDKAQVSALPLRSIRLSDDATSTAKRTSGWSDAIYTFRLTLICSRPVRVPVQVGISSCWYEGNSCNMHLNDLAARVKEGVQAANLVRHREHAASRAWVAAAGRTDPVAGPSASLCGQKRRELPTGASRAEAASGDAPTICCVSSTNQVGYRFNTIGVSDGISMGTEGMSFSLQSRDLIADSIETVRTPRRRHEPAARHAQRVSAPILFRRQVAAKQGQWMPLAPGGPTGVEAHDTFEPVFPSRHSLFR